MKLRLVAVTCCLTIAATLACAQNADEGYQMAKVVAFDKIAADAQHMETTGGYKISMRLADIIYICTASGDASAFLDWSVGKEFPTRLSGKVLQVKNTNGQIIELKITGKKKVK
jgi:hypothetical protein